MGWRGTETALKVVGVSGAWMVVWCLAPFPGSAWVGMAWHDSLVRASDGGGGVCSLWHWHTLWLSCEGLRLPRDKRSVV